MFPWKHYYLDDHKLRIRFANLRKYKPSLRKRKYQINNLRRFKPVLNTRFSPTTRDCSNSPQQLAIILGKNDYFARDEITDRWIEPVRVHARRYDADLTLHEFFAANTSKYAIARPADAFAARERLARDFYEVGTFRPSVAAAWIEILFAHNNIRILDFSAGWGDRMMAALAKNVVKYTGVDPNADLHPHYAQMHKWVRKHFASRTAVQMLCSRFEELDMTQLACNYDLVITSPPYFNLEAYSKYDEFYDSLDTWFNEFLVVAMQRAVSCLRSGGWFVLIINNMATGPDFALRATRVKLPAEFCGCIPYIGASPQPCWLWRKK